MNSPTIYLITTEGAGFSDTAQMEFGSNLDYIKQRAAERAETRNGPQMVYKLIPVMAYQLEVTTKIIFKNLEETAVESKPIGD